jgi:hypothetical protein
MKTDSFGKILNRAFTWRWNLLALGAGITLGILSGSPDVVLPIVAATELGYLGLIGTQQRFQNVLRGKELLAAGRDGPPPLPLASQLDRLLGQLSDPDIRRFQLLRNRCTALLKLRRRVQSSDPKQGGGSSFHIKSLDKLLWLFLKLLHQKNALAQFTVSTERPELVAESKKTEAEIESVREGSSHARLIQSLEEKLATIRSRIENYDQSEQNLRIIDVELDKTEQKISHIVELGMTSTDSTDLSAQIEALTMSVESNEVAMQDLNLHAVFKEDPEGPVPGLIELDDDAIANYVELE